MRAMTKRIIAVACAFGLAGSCHWLSGIPFQRSPGEALFFLGVVVFAAWVAAYPEFDE